MVNLDDLLLSRVFSPVSGWLKHQLGVCQWRLSVASLDVSIAAYLLGVGLSIAPKGMRDAIFVDLLSALVWLLIMSFLRDRAQRQAASTLGVQSARLGEWVFRTILTVMLPLSALSASSWPGLCYTASLLFLLCHLYLKAADTPPPTHRRLASLTH